MLPHLPLQCFLAGATDMDRVNNDLIYTDTRMQFFFLEAFCDISHRLGGITPFGVFSDAFPGLKMWVTFACATAIFLTHFVILIAVLEYVPPDAGLQKRATFPH
jgi:uncharacterized membrane protein YagU involved in acid resistance